MFLLIVAGFVFCMFISPAFRCAFFHPILTIRYAALDIYRYFKYKKYNNCSEFGRIVIYTGLFGRGKTLSCVHYANTLYKKYNGRKVYNFDTNEWEVQEIHFLSNVELKGLPHTKLQDTEQIVHCTDNLNSMSICFVLIDEASTQFNSRNFKTNISATLLNSMLTCRHHKFGMILTAQRFNQVDALIRQISEYAIECRKFWRFQVLYKASAWDMENCTNINMVKSISACWFVKDEDYAAYDTSAIVEDIKRKQKNGELLTDEEVLNAQGNTQTSEYNVNSPSRKLKKYMK